MHSFCCIRSFLVKCGGNLTERNGNFTSPGYPNDYPTNVNCTWEIQVPSGHVILLFFTSFNVEYNSGYVCSDFVDVYDHYATFDNYKRKIGR